MNNSIPLTKSNYSFWDYVWKDINHRKQLIIGFGISTFSFIIFKFFYPYPDFFSDSYSYIFAASANLDINIWPIGYSKFLSLVHFFTHSDIVLVSLQYFSIQFSAMYFYFTILYLFKIERWSQHTLFLFLFFNPLILYLANTINSDAMFAALSLLWLTELIWIVQKPHIRQLYLQAILLFLCFTIRNNAYYYPLIGTFAFILSRHSIQRKFIGIALPVLLLIPFINFTCAADYKLTGTREYSLFTGWQLANNALYIYDRVDLDSTILKAPEAKELNRLAINFFKDINSKQYHAFLNGYVGNFFIRESISPLKQYYSFHFKSTNDLSDIIAWSQASKAFESFGKPLILHHPFAYLLYFVGPNAWRYFIPPLSHLQRYNYGGNEIDPIAQSWFNYAQPKVYVFSHEFQGYLLRIYQDMFFILNLFFIWQMAYFCIKSKLVVKDISSTVASHYLFILFFFVNMVFSLFATTNILRYQVTPMFILLAYVLLPHNLPTESKIDTNEKLLEQLNIQSQTNSIAY